MGNQQSAALQLCSGSQLYTSRNVMATYKSSSDTRVGYIKSKDISTEPRFQVQRIQNTHQQIAPQQQGQEEIVEMISLSPKSLCSTQKQDVVNEKDVNGKKPTFNVYISCLESEEEPLPKINVVKPDEETEIIDHFGDDLKVFEGIFGNVIINKNGLILYTDITGKKHCEEYDRDEIDKIFPMGISYGGLTKTIWFDDFEARDNCFVAMTSLAPPSYKQVMANPEKFDFVEEEEEEEDPDDNMKVFEGINGCYVIVHADNLVLYTDISGKKHCIHYNKRTIDKCFPNGIHHGGLDRTIWLKDEMERDLCFMLMQWDLEDEEVEEIKEKSPDKNFTGLYGPIVLHKDSQIEFNSLSGERVKCHYKPSEIHETFPKGISYGRLPKTIWFRDIGERDRCIEAMRKL